MLGTPTSITMLIRTASATPATPSAAIHWRSASVWDSSLITQKLTEAIIKQLT
jgi:hypothetical protein